MPLNRLVTAALLSAASGLALAAQSIEAPGNLSEEAQAYLNKARVGDIDGSASNDPETLNRLRKALNGLFLKNAKKIDPDLLITEQDLGGVTGYWVNSTTPEKPGRVLLYIHGGGHIIGSAQHNLSNAIRISKASGMPILSVDYRLSPEHPYPADLNDALTAYHWLLAQGYKPEQIGVYGDSAGGGLALSLTLAAKDEGIPLPGAVMVMSPVTDVTWQGDSRIVLVDTDPVLRSPLKERYPMWVGEHDPKDPLISPLYGDYTDFPPLMIQVGTRERLMSDSIRLAQVARDAGTDVTLEVWDGMWHVWQDMPGLPEAEQACDNIAAFFTKHLQQ